ncbi:MAG: hypothetical protein A2086_16040 [Spirochaetes bacterium GWD1_27_9]|nr:MAG: hypothetical protein A2Y34_11065 [Spirochaetes bacterium GWC1_27_15]OHD36226.1 MAG: hypothetical protein A2086_16040 [Spirochaetes bacterium GWD1_27_9]
MNNIKLKNLIIYYALFVFLVPIITIGLGSTIIIYFSSKNYNLNQNISFVKNISQKIENFLDEASYDLELISDYIKERNAIHTNNEDIKKFIHLVFNHNKKYENIFLYDSNGKVILAYPENIELADLDYSKRDFIEKVLTTKNPYWSKPQISPLNGNLLIFISIPILKNDEIIGIVSGTINLSMITSFFETIKDTKVLITDKTNQIIVPVFTEENFEVKSSKLNNQGETLIINDIKYFVFYEYLSSVDWSIILLQEYSLAFKSLNNIKILTIIYFIIGLLITIFCIIFGFYLIFNPLLEITYQTTKVAYGEHSLMVKNYSVKELNVLKKNFNRMLKKIFKRENDLKESELKYKKLVEESQDFFFKISKNMRFIFLSPSIEKYFGFSPSEFLQKRKKYLVLNKMNIDALKITRNVFKTKKNSPPFYFEILHKNGERIILEIQETPIIVNDEVIEIQGSARDVTSRFNAEQQINYLKNYLSNIIEAMPSAIITTNNEGYINQFNTAARKMIGKNKDDIQGKILWDVSERFNNYYDCFEEAKRKNEVVEFREEIKINIRDSKYYNVYVFPLVSNERKEMVVIIDDVSKIEKTEMQLRQSQKLEIIGTMSGGLAHDFNNILGAILGTLTLIEFRAKHKKSISYHLLQDDLNTIKEASTKATKIIQQLMTLSRKQSISMEMIDLNNEINQVVNICRNTFGKQIKIDFKHTKEPAWAEGSANQIEQLFLNLLVNAKDSMNEVGTIDINIEKISSDISFSKKVDSKEGMDFWYITVSDNGEGIPEEYKDLIFDPFFTTKEKGKGTGLGLTMVYNIVKQHKGYIDFDSDIGKGTTFKIYLPVKEIHSYVTEEKHKKNKIQRGEGLILVVDDEEYIRYTAKEILKECGYDIILAKDGEEAVNIFRENYKEIKAVLLDMVMPQKTGKEAYIEMKKIDKNIKVLLTSAVKTDPRISETMSLGVKYFLLKPYTFEELSTWIYKLLHDTGEK